MERVLVTGGSGALGREVVARLLEKKYTVRVLTRQRALSAASDVELARGFIATGEGVRESLSGVEIVVHCATSPFRKTWQVDVEGTRHLVEGAKAAGVAHLLYISIVGIDKTSYPYYAAKLAAEEIIQRSGLPYTIVRATQFYSLIQLVTRMLNGGKLPLALVDREIKFQGIDGREVAERLVELVERGPAQRVSDIGGPQVRTLEDLMKVAFQAQGRRVAMIPVRIPGVLANVLRSGINLSPEYAVGKTTWEEFLKRENAMQ